jgi:hypothetical protein
VFDASSNTFFTKISASEALTDAAGAAALPFN